MRALLSRVALILFSLLWFSPVSAQNEYVEGAGYIASIELHTTEELHAVLLRAEQMLMSGKAPQNTSATVTFVLHGPEVKSLLRHNYLQYKSTVDLAARLSALGVVDIKACRTWMGGNSVDPQELQPFVGTVSYGPGEIRRLLDNEGYIDF